MGDQSKSENNISTGAAMESSSIEPSEKSDNSNIKKPRGRPPKKKQTTETKVLADNDDVKGINRTECKTGQTETNENLATSLTNVFDKRSRYESEESQRSTKRSRLYTDEIDEDIDCLSLLPTTGMESGLSSEAPSIAGPETE